MIMVRVIYIILKHSWQRKCYLKEDNCAEKGPFAIVNRVYLSVEQKESRLR